MQGPGLLQEVLSGQQQGRPGALSKVQQIHVQGQHEQTPEAEYMLKGLRDRDGRADLGR